MSKTTAIQREQKFIEKIIRRLSTEEVNAYKEIIATKGCLYARRLFNNTKKGLTTNIPIPKQNKNSITTPVLPKPTTPINKNVEIILEDNCLTQYQKQILDTFQEKVRISKSRIFMKEEHVFLPETPGVYLLNDFYVGESLNVYKRCNRHIFESLNEKHVNSRVSNAIISSLKNNTFKAVLLDSNPNKEWYWYQRLKEEGYPLLNQAGNDNNLTGKLRLKNGQIILGL